MKENLIKQIKAYIVLIQEEYLKNADFPLIDVNEISMDWNNIVNIEDTGTISLYVSSGKFYFPKSSDEVFSLYQTLPGYGADKNHTIYNDDTLIRNDNTFNTYINHLIVSGKNSEDYYLDNVLHETMHFCGAAGGTALEEGFTELKTRELALKKNLRTSGCGYPKEIKIVLKLQEIFGKDVCDILTFMNSFQEKLTFLKYTLNENMANLYLHVYIEMEKEFQEKYYQFKFPGITGPEEKALKYNNIDYSEIEKYIDQFNKAFNTNKSISIL